MNINFLFRIFLTLTVALLITACVEPMRYRSYGSVGNSYMMSSPVPAYNYNPYPVFAPQPFYGGGGYGNYGGFREHEREEHEFGGERRW